MEYKATHSCLPDTISIRKVILEILSNHKWHGINSSWTKCETHAISIVHVAYNIDERYINTTWHYVINMSSLQVIILSRCQHIMSPLAHSYVIISCHIMSYHYHIISSHHIIILCHQHVNIVSSSCHSTIDCFLWNCPWSTGNLNNHYATVFKNNLYVSVILLFVYVCFQRYSYICWTVSHIYL